LSFHSYTFHNGFPGYAALREISDVSSTNQTLRGSDETLILRQVILRMTIERFSVSSAILTNFLNLGHPDPLSPGAAF